MANLADDIDRLYNDHLDDLYIYAQNLGFDKDTSIDAIHDVFCKLYTNQGILLQIKNPKYYLFRSLRNRLLDIYRTTKEFVSVDDAQYLSDKIPFELYVTIEDELINEEDQRALKQQVDDLLSILTNRQKEIVYLRFLHNYSYEEISQMMNITVPACHKLLSKTLAKLKRKNLAFVVLLLILFSSEC